MIDYAREELRVAVEALHGVTATFMQTAPVCETFRGQAVWEGVVHVFHLEGHPTATQAYAWSSPREGSSKRRLFAVLNLPPISSPASAVRAAIIQEHRNADSTQS